MKGRKISRCPMCEEIIVIEGASAIICRGCDLPLVLDSDDKLVLEKNEPAIVCV